jgi:DNA-binding transcriptional LysR family regulator
VAELRHYRYFVEIARRGSFTAASATLHVTQSALSEQIRHLERELGCVLFDRGRHGAKLTTAGESLLPQAEQLLRSASEIERSARNTQLNQRDIFRVALTMSPLMFWMPTVLAELRREHKRVDVYLEDERTAEILLRVSSGEIDLGITSLGPSVHLPLADSGLITEVLVEDDWVLFVPEGHQFSKAGSVFVADLRDEVLIAFPKNSSLRPLVDELLVQAGVTRPPAIETGWMEMAIRYVSFGLGVCLAPRAVTLLDHPGVDIVEIADPERPHRTLAAMYRRDSPRIAFTKRVLAKARTHLEPLR